MEISILNFNYETSQMGKFQLMGYTLHIIFFKKMCLDLKLLVPKMLSLISVFHTSYDVHLVCIRSTITPDIRCTA